VSAVQSAFDRDTAVRRLAPAPAAPAAAVPAPAPGLAPAPAAAPAAPAPARPEGAGEDGVATLTAAEGALFEAEVSPEWSTGRGPHGGYLAAMILRALVETVGDPTRAPRSLTIHYARAPRPGPVSIATTVERAGRSLSTVSARMEQEGRLMALALSAFSVPWEAPELAEAPALPRVAGPDDARETSAQLLRVAPRFTRHLVLQPRIGAAPFQGSEAPMEVGAWLGTAEPRAIDALSLAFFSDALFSPPYIRLTTPAFTPTIDLTIHFRAHLPRAEVGDPRELCFARFRSTLVHEGFFEEDGTIWAPDGTLLAQSRQLAIVMPIKPRPGEEARGH